MLICGLAMLQEQHHHTQLPFSQEASWSAVVPIFRMQSVWLAGGMLLCYMTKVAQLTA